MDTTANTTRGSCLCGDVRYLISGPLGDIVHCHCTTCRKAHGSAFSSVAAVADNDFTINSPLPLGSFESSPGKRRFFCSRCASQIYAKRAGTAHIILRLGTLDSPVKAVEKNHIWTSQKASWYTLDSQLPRCETFE
ncbi:MAG: GFA family protein [Pseudomonadales bacterium]